MRTLKIAAFAFAVLAATPAWAAPREIAETIHAAKPYGKGAVSFLFMTAYDATLWTDAPHWSMDSCFALTLHYGMGFSTDELVDRTMSEMTHVAPHLDVATQARYRAMLPKLFPGVKSGDTITALHTPGQPTKFYHNGTLVGQSDDAGFAAPFFAIWLSPATSDPGLRRKLLAQNKPA
ncbi:MAG TPA: chalcone isomerase family protein [Rhizomicrobium sp.]|nr:chalcone isomerase family protein [Rhizomicrobium sp.]